MRTHGASALLLLFGQAVLAHVAFDKPLLFVLLQPPQNYETTPEMSGRQTFPPLRDV